MLSRQDRRQIIMIYSVGIIVFAMACIMIYRVIYEPLSHELRYLHQQISSETPSDINGMSTALGEYEPWLSGLHVSQEQLRSQLAQLFFKTHVQLKEMRFGERVFAAPFYEMPIHLNLTGNYASVMHFFVALTNSHLIFSFKKLMLAKSNAALQAAMVLQLRTF